MCKWCKCFGDRRLLVCSCDRVRLSCGACCSPGPVRSERLSAQLEQHTRQQHTMTAYTMSASPMRRSQRACGLTQISASSSSCGVSEVILRRPMRSRNEQRMRHMRSVISCHRRRRREGRVNAPLQLASVASVASVATVARAALGARLYRKCARVVTICWHAVLARVLHLVCGCHALA